MYARPGQRLTDVSFSPRGPYFPLVAFLPGDIRHDLSPDLSDSEGDRLVAIGLRLRGEMPTPDPEFRSDLRERLQGKPAESAARALPERVLALTYAMSGLLLLAVAALGLVSVGPFATG